MPVGVGTNEADENDDDGHPHRHIEMTAPSSSMSQNDETAATSTTTSTPYRTAVQRFFYPLKSQTVSAMAEGSVHHRHHDTHHHRYHNDDDESNNIAAGMSTPPSSRSSGGASAYSQAATNSNGMDHRDADERQQRPESLFARGRLRTLPPRQQQRPHNENDFGDMNDPDVKFVHGFWTTFDDILILSIFTQLGIAFRLASSTWFAYFDDVFSTDSALFVNLPLNCLSCFLMGLLCPGERLMEIIHTRFSPPMHRHDRSILHSNSSDTLRRRNRRRETHVIDDDDDNDVDDHVTDDGVLRENVEFESTKPRSGFGLRRRRQTAKRLTSHDRNVAMAQFWQHNEEMRDVQLLALERRIRMSKCLLLFPVRKQDVDVMEHYFDSGYKKRPDRLDEENHEEDTCEVNEPAISTPPRNIQRSFDTSDLDEVDLTERQTSTISPRSPTRSPKKHDVVRVLSNPAPSPRPPPPVQCPPPVPPTETLEQTEQKESAPTDSEFNADFIAEFTNNVQENVQENIERLRRVNLADGWDSGTSPEAMSDDLLLGLRDGFCGALSSFSSWNSSMIRLMRHGNFGHAFVGYMLGVQLPIIAYRCGQHVAMFIFVWRTRRETRIDEKRGGYGIRVNDSEESDRSDDPTNVVDDKKSENEMPSLRAVITAFFILALVTQCMSINFFSDPNDQQIALSLLFSPLGVFARWRIAKLNNLKPTFPLGTFTCNILACALSGSLGSLLAGNPGPRERIVLVSIVAGFGGTLSSVAAFVVEVLAGVDPILFRFDGVVYALASIGCAMVVGFVFSASAEWADETSSSANLIVKDDSVGDNETRWF